MFASALARRHVQPPPPERALLWSVLASIALHALVLFGLSQSDEPSPPVKALLVLTARLAPVAAVPGGPPQSQPQRQAQVQPQPQLEPQPEPQPKTQVEPQPKPVSAPRPPTKKPVPARASTPQEIAPTEAAKTASPMVAPVSSAPASSASLALAPASAASGAQAVAPGLAGSGTQGPSGAGAPSGTDADAGTLEQYRLALIKATKRYKRYPAVAMEKGWQGRVEVRMVIGANGMLAGTSVKTSSGHQILDDQAMDMLKKGKTTVQIPAKLRGREFSVDVPVIFNLENPNS